MAEGNNIGQAAAHRLMQLSFGINAPGGSPLGALGLERRVWGGGPCCGRDELHAAVLDL